MTLDQLQKIAPYAKDKAGVFLPFLNAAMQEFEINTPAREAAFIAQITHESGQFRYVEEIASGDAYESRHDLGNVLPGDGVKYKGRGLIQLTGKINYIAAMMALNINCVDVPELLETPENACRSAAWFWATHHLNELADKGDFAGITKRINGGLTHEAEREALWEVAKKVLEV